VVLIAPVPAGFLASQVESAADARGDRHETARPAERAVHRASDEADSARAEAAPHNQVVHDLRIGPGLSVRLLLLRPGAELDYGRPGVGQCQQDLFPVLSIGTVA
jgi:hypothetical protein